MLKVNALIMFNAGPVTLDWFMTPSSLSAICMMPEQSETHFLYFVPMSPLRVFSKCSSDTRFTITLGTSSCFERVDNERVGLNLRFNHVSTPFSAEKSARTDGAVAPAPVANARAVTQVLVAFQNHKRIRWTFPCIFPSAKDPGTLGVSHDRGWRGFEWLSNGRMVTI